MWGVNDKNASTAGNQRWYLAGARLLVAAPTHREGSYRQWFPVAGYGQVVSASSG